jgi:hypothetical protein
MNGRQEITQEVYRTALEVVQPVVWVEDGAYVSALNPTGLDDEPYTYPGALPTFTGFLQGEPDAERTCRVTGRRRATYRAYMEEDGRYFRLDEPLTIPEFLRPGSGAAR